jgi:hypothetical protein
LDTVSRGGGIIIYHRDHLRVKTIALSSSPVTFEALAVSISSSCGPLTVLAIYRPGSSPPSSLFFYELGTVLEQFVLHNTQLAILGDLNLHLENATLPSSIDFQLNMEQFGSASE